MTLEQQATFLRDYNERVSAANKTMSGADHNRLALDMAQEYGLDAKMVQDMILDDAGGFVGVG